MFTGLLRVLTGWERPSLWHLKLFAVVTVLASRFAIASASGVCFLVVLRHNIVPAIKLTVNEIIHSYHVLMTSSMIVYHGAWNFPNMKAGLPDHKMPISPVTVYKYLVKNATFATTLI